MKSIEEMLNPATSNLLDARYVVAVARHKGVIHWRLSEHDNLVLDWKKWRDEFVAAGYEVPDQAATATERSNIIIVDQNNAEQFLSEPVTHKLSVKFLRDALLKRFPSAKSWWDVDFLFPVAFIDFDKKHFVGFYQDGPRLERYVPEGWIGEFADFANSYPEEIFPAADKFWIVDDRNFLHELNQRGQVLVANKTKVEKTLL